MVAALRRSHSSPPFSPHLSSLGNGRPQKNRGGALRETLPPLTSGGHGGGVGPVSKNAESFLMASIMYGSQEAKGGLGVPRRGGRGEVPKQEVLSHAIQVSWRGPGASEPLDDGRAAPRHHSMQYPVCGKRIDGPLSYHFAMQPVDGEGHQPTWMLFNGNSVAVTI